MNRNIKLKNKDFKNIYKSTPYFLIPFLNLTNFSNSGSLNILNIEDTMRLYDVYFTEIDKIIKKYQQNIYLLKYEDIILNPKPVLKDLFNFCNLDSSNIKLPELINKDRVYNYKSEKVKFNSEKYAYKLKEYGYSI